MRLSLTYTRDSFDHNISEIWLLTRRTFPFFAKVSVVSGEPKENWSPHRNVSSTAAALAWARRLRSWGGILGLGLRGDDHVVRRQRGRRRCALAPPPSRGCWQMSFGTGGSASSSQYSGIGQLFSITSAESAGCWQHKLKLWARRQECIVILVVFRLLLNKPECF